ncbi:hypothetical protein FQR65_LT16539 [Abscondita terminalis]|nr:hypothetical protein FQR65_LT16539 [Abscondita terminalis]
MDPQSTWTKYSIELIRPKVFNNFHIACKKASKACITSDISDFEMSSQPSTKRIPKKVYSDSEDSKSDQADLIVPSPPTVPGNNIIKKSHTTSEPNEKTVRAYCSDEGMSELPNGKLCKETFPQIHIKSDQTPSEIQELNNLRKELDRLKKSGEINATIKYVNNIPKIVTIKQTLKNRPKRPRDNEDNSPKRGQGIKAAKNISLSAEQ